MRGQEARRLVTLAVPVAAANLVQVAVVVTDSVLLGRSAPGELAGAALAVPVYLVALILLRSWSTAVQILVARAHGAGDRRTRDDVLMVGMAASLISGLVLASAITSLRAPLLDLIGGDSPAVGPAARYLAVLVWALPLMGAVLAIQAFFIGVNRPRVTLVSNVVVGAVNLVVGLVLVTLLGFGVVGAGAATVVSATFAAAYLAARARSALVRVAARPGSRTATARNLWRLAWPESTLYLVGYGNEVALVAFVAVIGDLDLAAYRLLDSVTTVVYTLFAAAGTAVTIALAHELGAGRRPSPGVWVQAGIVVGTVLAAPVVLAVVVLPGLFFTLLTSDPDTAGVAVSAAAFAMLSIAPVVVTLCLGGALRAYRRNVWLMVASLIADAVALVPLAWLLGIREGLGLEGVYLAWSAYAVLNLVLVLARFRTLVRTASARLCAGCGEEH